MFFKDYDLKKASEGICDICNKVASKVCIRCNMIHYCSLKCYRIGWKKHKKDCGFFRRAKL